MKNPIVFPLLQEENRWQFTLWAPELKDVKLELEQGNKTVDLHRGEFGYWSTIVENLKPGTRYKYKINKKKQLP